MGIDKPDVRAVIHHRFALSVDDYLQQAGRAGRDGKRSYCRVYFGKEDLNLLNFISRGDNKKNSVEECQNYCYATTCRHVILAKSVGDDIPPCERNCDVCHNPDTVKRAVELCQNSDSRASTFKGKRGRSSLLSDIAESSNGHEEVIGGESSYEPKQKVAKFNIQKRKVTYVDADSGK